MQDLSLHILDIAENSIRAGATRVKIMIEENIARNRLSIRISDNGKGIGKKDLKKVLDPFYTTKKGKKIGLGLSLLNQSAEESSGSLSVSSRKGKGTSVQAVLVYDHIDRRPLGNISDTLLALVGTHGDTIDFVYTHKKNDRGFTIDTRMIKRVLGDLSIKNYRVMSFLRSEILKELTELDKNIERRARP